MSLSKCQMCSMSYVSGEHAAHRRDIYHLHAEAQQMLSEKLHHIAVLTGTNIGQEELITKLMGDLATAHSLNMELGKLNFKKNDADSALGILASIAAPARSIAIREPNQTPPVSLDSPPDTYDNDRNKLVEMYTVGRSIVCSDGVIKSDRPKLPERLQNTENTKLKFTRAEVAGFLRWLDGDRNTCCIPDIMQSVRLSLQCGITAMFDMFKPIILMNIDVMGFANISTFIQSVVSDNTYNMRGFALEVLTWCDLVPGDELKNMQIMCARLVGGLNAGDKSKISFYEYIQMSSVVSTDELKRRGLKFIHDISPHKRQIIEHLMPKWTSNGRDLVHPELQYFCADLYVGTYIGNINEPAQYSYMRYETEIQANTACDASRKAHHELNLAKLDKEEAEMKIADTELERATAELAAQKKLQDEKRAANAKLRTSLKRASPDPEEPVCKRQTHESKTS